MLSSNLIPVTFNEFKNIGGWVVRLSNTTGSFPLLYDADSTDTVYIGFGLAEDDKKYRLFDGVLSGYGTYYVPFGYPGQKIVFNSDITPDASPTSDYIYANDNTSFSTFNLKNKPYAFTIQHISSYDITVSALITDQTISDYVWINETDNIYTTDTTCIIIKKEINDETGGSATLLINDYLKLKNDILYYYGLPVYRSKENHLVISVEKHGNRRLFVVNGTILETAKTLENTTFTTIKTINSNQPKYNYFVYIGSY